MFRSAMRFGAAQRLPWHRPCPRNCYRRKPGYDLACCSRTSVTSSGTLPQISHNKLLELDATFFLRREMWTGVGGIHSGARLSHGLAQLVSEIVYRFREEFVSGIPVVLPMFPGTLIAFLAVWPFGF